MVFQTLSSAKPFRKANVVHIGKKQPCHSKNKSFGVFLYYYKLFLVNCQEKIFRVYKKYTNQLAFYFIEFEQKAI
jgi:hypothetical protein